jgi:predicted nucleic acid-binding protein
VVLVDTSVWINHLHRSNHSLVDALDRSLVAQHPMVIGELALGSLSKREAFLQLLADLPPMPVATHEEVLHFVNQNHLYGQGLSLVDAHLLASVTLSSSARIWTEDKRLSTAADQLGIAYRQD